MIRLLGLLFCALLVSFAAPRALAQGKETPVTIFAAASTTDAVTEIAAAYAAVTGATLRPVFAASSTLARQIAQAAPADLYLSASNAWMKHLQAEALIDAASLSPLLANRLVLVAPADSPLQVQLTPQTDLGSALGRGRMAIGDPAREALESLGLWNQVADKLAQSSNVRAALALVERGEAAAGIVYATDAAISPGVKVVTSFPTTATPEITYPLAIITGRDRPAVRRAYDFLRGRQAADIFRKHGFTAAAGAS